MAYFPLPNPLYHLSMACASTASLLFLHTFYYALPFLSSRASPMWLRLNQGRPLATSQIYAKIMHDKHPPRMPINTCFPILGLVAVQVEEHDIVVFQPQHQPHMLASVHSRDGLTTAFPTTVVLWLQLFLAHKPGRQPIKLQLGGMFIIVKLEIGSHLRFTSDSPSRWHSLSTEDECV